MHSIAGDPALLIDGQASVAKSHPEVKRHLYCFHPRNEILMRLYEVFETSKKQDPTHLFLIFISKIDNLYLQCYIFNP